MKLDSRIFVAGHRGLVGSTLVRHLKELGYSNLVLRTRDELDLLNQSAVNDFFSENKIDFVFVAAAKVGGILANSQYQADFLYENLMISINVIHASFKHNVEKLLYLGSSCIYPKMAAQPIEEASLLTGPLESTNEGYAIAKIAALKLCEMYQRQYGRRFISAMPTNLYGPGDNFHPENSHVIPGMMRRFHEAKRDGVKDVVVWGTGKPLREFLHVADLVKALVTLMEHYEDSTTINVGTGKDCSISELAHLMAETVGYQGAIKFDSSKPDGTPRKLLNIEKLQSLGWQPQFTTAEGLKQTYKWAVENRVF